MSKLMNCIVLDYPSGKVKLFEYDPDYDVETVLVEFGFRLKDIDYMCVDRLIIESL